MASFGQFPKSAEEGGGEGLVGGVGQAEGGSGHAGFMVACRRWMHEPKVFIINDLSGVIGLDEGGRDDFAFWSWLCRAVPLGCPRTRLEGRATGGSGQVRRHIPPCAASQAGIFAASDTLEFRHNDPAAVVAALQPLASSTGRAVRAAALAGLGRQGAPFAPHALRPIVKEEAV